MNESNLINNRDSTNVSSVAAVSQSLTSNDETGKAVFQCPACRAKQVWSSECRRCKTDLTLLRRFEEDVRRQRKLVLTALRFNRNAVALQHAKRLYQSRPDDASARLLAVCHLASGNFSQACGIARIT